MPASFPLEPALPAEPPVPAPPALPAPPVVDPAEPPDPPVDDPADPPVAEPPDPPAPPEVDPAEPPAPPAPPVVDPPDPPVDEPPEPPVEEPPEPPVALPPEPVLPALPPEPPAPPLSSSPEHAKTRSDSAKNECLCMMHHPSLLGRSPRAAAHRFVPGVEHVLFRVEHVPLDRSTVAPSTIDDVARSAIASMFDSERMMLDIDTWQRCTLRCA